ncbi:MAG: hypothetical protein V4550_07270 [Gemmatimonadota bacterium]
MRTDIKLGMLSLPLLLAACSRSEDGIAGTSAKAATTTPSYAELTPAPQSAQRMRFVSDIERAKPRSGGTPLRTVATHSMVMPEAIPAHDPYSALAVKPPTVLASDARAEDATLVVAMKAPAEAPSSASARPDLQQMAMIDHAGEMPRDPVSLTPPFSVVIRGGRTGNEKCDPRTDTHTTPQEIGRPNLAMPLVPQGRAFGGGFRR